MKVKLIKSYHNLSNKSVYEVVGIEADDYRIIDDHNDPFLFERKRFKVVDKKEPSFWINEYGQDNERYSYPKEWNRVGFFEDYFDGKRDAILKFESLSKKYYPKSFAKYSDIKKILNYFKTYHKNLFSNEPFYGFRLIKVNPKSIKIEIIFKKGQKYCCVEPLCHFTPDWDALMKYGKNRIEAKFICETGSYCMMNRKRVKNSGLEYIHIFKTKQGLS